MRFCNSCGFQIGGAQPAAPVGAAPSAGQPASPYGSAPAPVCWRCRSIGESGADFCKFCGARYADGAPRNEAPAASSLSGPAPGIVEAAASAAAVALSPMSMGAPLAPVGYPPAPAAPAPAGQTVPSPIAPSSSGAIGAAAPQPAPMPTQREVGAVASARAGASYGTLVAIMKDGSDGRAYPVVDDPTDIGRTEGHIILGDDPYLSPRHVRLVPRPDGLLVRDLDSVNGAYVRLRDPVELHDGDLVLLGQQLLRFEILPEAELPLGPAMHAGVLVFGTPEVARLARLVQYTTEGVGRDVHYLYRDETTIGREQGDVVCTDDPFMSRRHAAITLDRSQRRFVLRDLSSSNGSALRIRGERLLKVGDQFRVGRHLFRYDPPGAVG